MVIKLSYLVLYSPDIEKLRQFYEKIGLQFKQEQHGKGPVHYSTQVEGIVLEIYPHGDDRPKKQRIGFTIPNLEITVNQIASSFPFAIKSISTKNAILIDPDYRTIELTQK